VGANWHDQRAEEYERRSVEEYFALEAAEPIAQIRKIGSRRIMGTAHGLWEVASERAPYWVMTSPTALYAQGGYRDLEDAFTYHLRAWAEVMDNHDTDIPDEQRDRLAGPWRQWRQAADALAHAEEAEEFQAIAARCRQCLLALVHEAAADAMVPEGEQPPQRDNFLQWSEHIAAAIARGASAERIRAHLRATARSTWQLAAWATHYANANDHIATLVLQATYHVLVSFGLILCTAEHDAPQRCPECASYKLRTAYRSEPGGEIVPLVFCQGCSWEELLPAAALSPAEEQSRG